MKQIVARSWRWPPAARPAPAFSSSTVDGADAQRKQHQPAEPEREGERRRADEAVVAARRAARAAVAVADRQHVAMEMHRALRLAGGAGGEGDQADSSLAVSQAAKRS